MGTHGCPEPVPGFRGDTATPPQELGSVRCPFTPVVPSRAGFTPRGFRRCLGPLSIVS